MDFKNLRGDGLGIFENTDLGYLRKRTWDICRAMNKGHLYNGDGNEIY